jgi:hypothetical protein
MTHVIMEANKSHVLQSEVSWGLTVFQFDSKGRKKKTQ